MLVPIWLTLLVTTATAQFSMYSLSKRLRMYQLIEELKSLVSTPVSKIPGPCFNIPGPENPKDRIAIVGGGIAGLHMAYMLKKRGFERVTILEKKPYIGGKIWSYRYEKTVHEMGACYITPEYEHNLIALGRELGISEDDLVPVPSTSSAIWFDSLERPLTFEQYVISEIIRITDATTHDDAILELLEATKRYVEFHLQTFGRYKGFLMRRPSRDTLESLRKSFKQFLQDGDMVGLEPFLVLTQTLQGYGYLDRVSTIYGLIWNTPSFIVAMVTSALTGQYPIKIFRNGFGQFIHKLSRDLDIRNNVHIRRITRSDVIRIQYENGEEEQYDFLIWAGNAKDALHVMDEPSDVEESMFSKLNPAWFATTLISVTKPCEENITFDRWMSAIYQQKQFGVVTFRDTKGVLQEGRECPIPGNATRITGVAYQYGTHKKDKKDVQQVLHDHYSKLSIEEKELIQTVVWEYFPHFSIKDMSHGILWDILRNQGHKKTWFIGSSVSYEAVNFIIEYNKEILRLMNTHGECRCD